MPTPKQIAANQSNAKKSTGPVTPAGKSKSRLNALRHGLTGQVTLMPEEDRAAFNSFCIEIAASLHPDNAFEHQLAHSIAEDTWRLNRARALENNIFALGHADDAHKIRTSHPEAHAALTAAHVFTSDPHQFQLLSLYMQRTTRDMQKNLATLRQLQADRKALRQQDLEETTARYSLNTMKHLPFNPDQHPGPNGFVFSTPELTLHAARHRDLKDAPRAAFYNFDLKRFQNSAQLFSSHRAA